MKSPLFIIDISSFIFRAFYAVRELKNSKGEPTNAIYGVASMLGKLIETHKPEYIAVVYDSKEPSHRKEVYTEYKANRSAPPEALLPQFDRIEQLISAMGFCSFRKSGIEADDLIGSLAKLWVKQFDSPVRIVTGDKDLMQLVSDKVFVVDTMKDATFDPAAVHEKFGVPPERIRDYLALIGDSSDNIPGVASIGPKSAVQLIEEWGGVSDILEAAKAGKIPGKKGAVLQEHEAMANLSYELVSLRCDLLRESDVQPERLISPFLTGKIVASTELQGLLKELELRTLNERWSAPTIDTSAASSGAMTQTGLFSSSELKNEDLPFKTVFKLSEWKAIVADIRATKLVSFDLETTSLNPRLAKIVGISICLRPDCAYYVPLLHNVSPEPQLKLEELREDLESLLRDLSIKWMGHNLKYDWSILNANGFYTPNVFIDTMLVDYVLQPETKHNLQLVAQKWLGYSMLPYEAVCGKGVNSITFDAVPVDVATRYSAEDSWICRKLWDVFEPKIMSSDSIWAILRKLDLPLVRLLMQMESNGIQINVDYLKNLKEEFASELSRLQSEIEVYGGPEVNIQSPKQLAELLFVKLGLPTQGKTKTGFSTDVDVLEKLMPLHPVPRLIMEYREIAKLQGTYVDPLPALRDPKTDRIHTHFHQTVTATGRLSSNEPNLQNIPIRTTRGKKIRKAFVAAEGSILISADYSQIELRILAELSGDTDLIESFKQDKDIHRRTAAELFDVSEEFVSNEQRSYAKAINFGLMYGKTAFGLAQELGISRTEAKNLIDRYFARYNRVKLYLDSLIIQAKEKGFTETWFGRRRDLPDLNSKNPAVRGNAERMAMNTPIQGTAADLMKLAMLNVDQGLTQGKFSSKLLLQVHDELVIEVPHSEVAAVKELVRFRMETAMQLWGDFLKSPWQVPLKADVAMGQNWLEVD